MFGIYEHGLFILLKDRLMNFILLSNIILFLSVFII